MSRGHAWYTHQYWWPKTRNRNCRGRPDDSCVLPGMGDGSGEKGDFSKHLLLIQKSPGWDSDLIKWVRLTFITVYYKHFSAFRSDWCLCGFGQFLAIMHLAASTSWLAKMPGMTIHVWAAFSLGRMLFNTTFLPKVARSWLQFCPLNLFLKLDQKGYGHIPVPFCSFRSKHLGDLALILQHLSAA